MNKDNTKYSVTLGSRIRDIRENLGLSMAEFATKISPPAASSNVSNWENNKVKPNAERTKSIAELGGVTIDYLLTGKKSPLSKQLLGKNFYKEKFSYQAKFIADLHYAEITEPILKASKKESKSLIAKKNSLPDYQLTVEIEQQLLELNQMKIKKQEISDDYLEKVKTNLHKLIDSLNTKPVIFTDKNN